MTVQFLWDPYSEDIEEWQAFRSPSDLVAGPTGELIVADRENHEVTHFTPDGNLIGLVGRRGSGPGEFGMPLALTYNENNSELLVVDPLLGRISAFKLDSGVFLFSDIIPIPQFESNKYPSPLELVVSDSKTIWVSSLGNDHRIHRMNRDGKILDSFGDVFVPDEVENRQVFHYNDGSLIPVGTDSLIFIWYTRPRIEIWDVKGNLLSDREYWFPELSDLTDSRFPYRETAYPRQYVLDAHFDDRSQTLFFCLLNPVITSYVIYEVEMATLKPLRKFILPKEAGQLGLHDYAVIRTETGLCFYVIDTQSYGVVAVEPLR